MEVDKNLANPRHVVIFIFASVYLSDGRITSMDSTVEDKGAAVVNPDAIFGADTVKSMKKIPLLKVRAGPRDKEYPERLKEELTALITVILQPHFYFTALLCS